MSRKNSSWSFTPAESTARATAPSCFRAERKASQMRSATSRLLRRETDSRWPSRPRIRTSLSSDSKPMSLRPTSLTTTRSAPFASIFRRPARFEVVGLGGEGHDRLAALQRAAGSRGRRVREKAASSPAPPARWRRSELSCGMKSATAAAMARPSHSGNSETQQRMELVGPCRSRGPGLPAGGGRSVGPGEQRHAGAAVARGFGQGVAHPSARPIRHEPDRVDRLARRPRGDEETQPREVPSRRGQTQSLRDDLGRLGHPARPLVPRSQRPGVRADEAHAPRGESLDVRAHGRVLPHRRLHRRSEEHRTRVRQEVCREKVVGQTVGELRHRVGRGRRDDEQIRPVGSRTWSTAGGCPLPQTSVRTSAPDRTANVSGERTPAPRASWRREPRRLAPADPAKPRRPCRRRFRPRRRGGCGRDRPLTETDPEEA